MILDDVERYKPQTVRDALFSFLEKFTSELFSSDNLDSPRTSNDGDAVSVLPEVQEPYLPPVGQKTFTLVLDLDETLIHYFDFEHNQKSARSSTKSEEEFAGHFLIRPYAREFLEKMSKIYEVVVFTAAM